MKKSKDRIILEKGNIYRIHNSEYIVLSYDKKAKTYTCKRIKLCGVTCDDKPHTFNPDNISIWDDFEIVKQ